MFSVFVVARVFVVFNILLFFLDRCLFVVFVVVFARFVDSKKCVRYFVFASH